MTVAYILAIVGGIAIGLTPSNVLWAILFMPLAILVLLLLAYFINIWVEHRYVTYPFERNARVTLDANKVLNKEIEEVKAENDECHSQILRNQTEHREALQRRQDVNTDLWFENDNLKKELKQANQLLKQREEKIKIYIEDIKLEKSKTQTAVKALEIIIGWNDTVETDENWEYPETIAEQALSEIKIEKDKR